MRESGDGEKRDASGKRKKWLAEMQAEKQKLEEEMLKAEQDKVRPRTRFPCLW